MQWVSDTRKPADVATALSPTNRQWATGTAARFRASSKKAGWDLSSPSTELNRQRRGSIRPDNPASVSTFVAH